MTDTDNNLDAIINLRVHSEVKSALRLAAAFARQDPAEYAREALAYRIVMDLSPKGGDAWPPEREAVFRKELGQKFPRPETPLIYVPPRTS